MSKFTCLVLFTVMVTISNIAAESSCREDFMLVEQECAKETGISKADMDATMDTSDVTKVNPCFWGCYFKKLGILNEKGQYDLNSGLAGLKKFSFDDTKFAKFEDTTKKCATVQDTPVSDGYAGCERGALLAACFMKNLHH